MFRWENNYYRSEFLSVPETAPWSFSTNQGPILEEYFKPNHYYSRSAQIFQFWNDNGCWHNLWDIQFEVTGKITMKTFNSKCNRFSVSSRYPSLLFTKGKSNCGDWQQTPECPVIAFVHQWKNYLYDIIVLHSSMQYL